VENGALLTDVRSKLMQIPAAVPGNLIGVEIEQQLQPYLLDAEWQLQDEIPVRDAHYTLRLPAGWDFKAVWLNHEPIAPIASGNGSWSWSAGGLPAVRLERDMPPWRGVAAHMVVALIPPNGKLRPLLTWQDVGRWQHGLVQDRDVATPAIHQKVLELTAGKTSKLEQVRALATFVQHDIRYVAIELGIGGYQPHLADDVFQHRYGDCKDKAALLHAMLADIGINSYYLAINTVRGNVTVDTPPNLGFNHVILAMQLPADTAAPDLLAWYPNAKVGRLLVFDPTDEYTPLGRLSGSLQANTALLVLPDGGELATLPQMRSDTSSLNRTATLALDAQGNLSGAVREVRTGDPAARERYELRNAAGNDDRIKPVEARLADSLSDFRIVQASVLNLAALDQPFEWRYTLEAQRYAKFAGELMLVRPRVLGTKSSGLLETREARENPIEFDGPRLDSDNFEITLPAGFEVDDVPPAVDVDAGFAAYHSKTQAVARTLRYTRTLEIRQLSVPLAKAGELKAFYRTIWNDERQTAVLRPIAR
ncbi:MAG: hypothetical protein JSR15_07100, partial [Proteobacteria bacterium]|nr:hypothetical protein [Pseudomonadota bacterium]